jgi:hypothetical protein
MGNLAGGVEMLRRSLVIREARSVRVVRNFNYSRTFYFIFYRYDLKNIRKRIVSRF